MVKHIYLPRYLAACDASQKCKRLNADQNVSKKTLMKADAAVVEACRQKQAAARVSDGVEVIKKQCI